MLEAKPRATKLMLHAFLGSNLRTCFIPLCGNGKLQSNLLVNCLKAHVTSLLLHTLYCVYKLSYSNIILYMCARFVYNNCMYL